MVVNVIGKSKVDFATADGQVIKGTSLYVSHIDEHVEGLKCEKFFVKSSIPCDDIKVGEQIELYFNQRGKIDSIRKSSK